MRHLWCRVVRVRSTRVIGRRSRAVPTFGGLSADHPEPERRGRNMVDSNRDLVVHEQRRMIRKALFLIDLGSLDQRR